jgi:arginyl-tRNA synthetase
MNVSQVLESQIKKAVQKVYDISLEMPYLEHPGQEERGDYASNVAMVLAKKVSQSPMEVAKKLHYELGERELFFESRGNKYPILESIEIAPPGFINFKLSAKWLQEVPAQVLREGPSYGSSGCGQGKKVLIEYSNPNTNKPLHVGHARNNFLGFALSKILAFQGYDVIKSNYLGDIGIHIAKTLLMYKKYGGNGDPGSKKPDHFVGEFYTMFEREVAHKPSLNTEALDLLQKWENKDPETLKLWEKMNNLVYEGWKQTYKDQQVDFDIWEYESQDVSAGKELAELAVQKGIATKDETGAIVAHLEKYNLPDKVLLRSDGTSVYSTKDLQLAKDSYEKYKFDTRLYVVDYRQGPYLQQIFKILELLGFSWAKNLYHVSYGTVSLPEGKMSSRAGRVVNADDVYATLVDLEQQEIVNNSKTSGKGAEEIEEIARRVALAAFKYGLLKVSNNQNVVFDYEDVSKFEGNTGPYLLYSYARARSVLRKAGFVYDPNVTSYDLEKMEDTLLQDKELALLRWIYRFPEVVDGAAAAFSPHLICSFLHELAQRFNSFYGTTPILEADSSFEKNFRLLLTSSVANVLSIGLDLLGIPVVEQM